MECRFKATSSYLLANTYKMYSLNPIYRILSSLPVNGLFVHNDFIIPVHLPLVLLLTARSLEIWNNIKGTLNLARDGVDIFMDSTEQLFFIIKLMMTSTQHHCHHPPLAQYLFGVMYILGITFGHLE